MAQTGDCVIQEIAEEDLSALARWHPGRRHKVYWRLQERGSITHLVAWVGTRPVAQASMRKRGPRDAAAARAYPGCPEIHGLGVAAPFRRRGVATRLLCEFEALAGAAGQGWIGLAVAESNEAAVALYQGCGYQFGSVPAYLDRWNENAPNGGRTPRIEEVRFMVKRLCGAADCPRPHPQIRL